MRSWCRRLLILSVLSPMGAFLATPRADAQGPSIVGTGIDGPINIPLRTSEPRSPGLIDPRCGAPGGLPLDSPSCNPQSGREWEGTTSTDYYTLEPAVSAPPNPDIAVGPEDILTVVNRVIARYPNPNAARYNNNGGNAPVEYNPAGTQFFQPTSQTFLDAWLGEAALNDMCPTLPRSNLSCVIENASIRYDQMQARFVVLFTVVDTGLVHYGGATGTPTTISGSLRRKASWVLVVSRWATGCSGSQSMSGMGVGGACVANSNPADLGETGNSEFFTTPQEPGPNQSNPNSGGVNTNWILYYGRPDGTCDDNCSFGNMNSISDLRRGVAAPAGARTIDCNNTAVGDASRVCYLPSSARLGFDNDNIVISSSVFNDNVPLAARTLANPAWEGTRARILKKAAIYVGLSSTPGSAAILPGSLAPIIPGAAQATPQLQGDYYDLYPNGNVAYSFFKDPVGINFEPVHLRGRPLASFSGNGGANGAFISMLSAQSVAPGGVAQTNLGLMTITFTAVATVLPGAGGNTTNRPLIQGGIPSLPLILKLFTVPPFTNPYSVKQRDKLVQPSPNNQLPTPLLYVGDNRPHRVIAREGFLFDARVGALPNTFNLDGAQQPSTVLYDVIAAQTTSTAQSVLNTSWSNGRFFAPMFEVPAHTVQTTGNSPLIALPSRAVSTTFPALATTDPRTFSYGNISGQALISCKGQQPTVSTSFSAYPSLFDMRCGEDAYDNAMAYRNPISGGFTPGDFQLPSQTAGFPNQLVPFGIRGGASTDPNTMGTWQFGAYAKARYATAMGYGQWGTYIAYYPPVFSTRDLNGNLISAYADVPPDNPFFTYIQIARQLQVGAADANATNFNPNAAVSRRDMATWVIRSLMDENAITTYLNATGGIQCSFADIPCPGAGGATVTNTTGVSSGWRYVEAFYRRGITRGCTASPRNFCPDSTLTRGQMAVFLIRAKMSQVFPSAPDGAATTTSCVPPGTPTAQVGDLFGIFSGCTPYFSDVPNTHPFFAYIQKLRELRVTNGTALSTPTTLGTYGPDDTLTRGQVTVFLVRAFFP